MKDYVNVLFLKVGSRKVNDADRKGLDLINQNWRNF